MFTQDKYQKAINFAAKAHGEQKTPWGVPYITHLSSVAMEVIHACAKSELKLEQTDLAITVSFLYKILEETEVTYDDIYKEFSAEVAEAVDALSIDKGIESKKEQMAANINNLLTQAYEVQMVKLAETIVNMQEPPASWDNLKVLNYHKEAKFILSCLKNCNIHLSKRLEDKINQYIIYINR